jgi:xanthine dehydrogenase small subunit
VPKLKSGEAFRAYKISKRFDQDISAVMAAFKISSARGRIISARIAYGGMAATPRRAVQAEAALVGAELANRASWQAAIDVLVMDFAPISDMRASATYRLEVAQALLRKALTEIAGGNSRRSRIAGARTAGSNGEAA